MTTMSADYRTKYGSTANKCECPSRTFRPYEPCKHMVSEMELDALAESAYGKYLDEAGKTLDPYDRTLQGGIMIQMNAIRPNPSFDFSSPKAQMIIQAFMRRCSSPDDHALQAAANAFCESEYGMSANRFTAAYKRQQGGK